MDIADYKSTPELDVFITDLNGNLRGKRIPASSAEGIMESGFKLPLSVMGLDFWGDDVPKNGLVFETGDSDGFCQIVSHQPLLMPWENGEHYQMMATMFLPDGKPFMGDPRQILSAVLERYKAKGLTPVVAAELEFYLLDASSELLAKPVTSKLLPNHGFPRPNAYALRDLNRFRPLLGDIRSACEIQGIPADALVAELGDAQFEVNLLHIDDALLAADQAVMFKRIVRSVARQHGHVASFMAKTYGDKSGNGFHLHFSLLDEQGGNVFANGTREGTDLLRYAVAGMLDAMPDSMLIFAPHLNSYRRLLPGSHAPIAANWGYENRTVAVRIPDSPDAARRIEHRVAGADANPYLVMAAILGAALHGIENELEPRPVTVGDGYAEAEAEAEAAELAEDAGEAVEPVKEVPTQWVDAMLSLYYSDLMPEIMGSTFVDVFVAMKEQELAKFARRITDAEYETYLGVV